MTKRSKTPHSAKGRKKGPERLGHGASQLIQDDDILGKADFLKETESEPENEDGRFIRRRDPLSRYMAEMGAVSDLLTPEEELTMGTVVRRGLAKAAEGLKKALRTAEKYRTWTPQYRNAEIPERIARAQELLRKFNPGGLKGAELDKHVKWASINDPGLAMLEWSDPAAYEVAERFIKANLRLVVSLARGFNLGYLPLADLIQEGNTGLVTAVLRFDPDRGFRFSTYASWWIRHAIGRGMADKGRTIRLPVHMIGFAMIVTRARREFIERLGRLPTDAELAKAADCTEDKLMLLRRGMHELLSLDAPVGEEQDDTLGSMLSGEPPETSKWATLIPEKERQFLREAIEALSPIERDVILLRFGFYDEEKAATLAEIGKKFSLSRERIRQLQERGLRKLRDDLSNRFAAAI